MSIAITIPKTFSRVKDIFKKPEFKDNHIPWYRFLLNFVTAAGTAWLVAKYFTVDEQNYKPIFYPVAIVYMYLFVFGWQKQLYKANSTKDQKLIRIEILIAVSAGILAGLIYYSPEDGGYISNMIDSGLNHIIVIFFYVLDIIRWRNRGGGTGKTT